MAKLELTDQLITRIANTMDVSEAYVRAAIDKLNKVQQPCFHHGPIQGFCKSAKCSECEVIKGERR